MPKEGMVWGFYPPYYRDPPITFMYLPRAHIRPGADFGKFSFVGPKNRFCPDWENVSRGLKNGIQVFFGVVLTPT